MLAAGAHVQAVGHRVQAAARAACMGCSNAAKATPAQAILHCNQVLHSTAINCCATSCPSKFDGSEAHLIVVEEAKADRRHLGGGGLLAVQRRLHGAAPCRWSEPKHTGGGLRAGRQQQRQRSAAAAVAAAARGSSGALPWLRAQYWCDVLNEGLSEPPGRPQARHAPLSTHLFHCIRPCRSLAALLTDH